MSGLPVYPAGVAGHASGDPILGTVTVRPEKNTTWEAGIKTSLFHGAATLDADAFYTKVEDFKANVVDNAAVVALRSYLANIPEVTVKGIELDSSARVGTHVTLRLAGAYADGVYASYPAGPCPIELTGSSTTSCNLTGKGMPGLPRWSGSAGGEYSLPVTRGDAFLRADLFSRTSIYGDASDSAYTVIGGYTLLNASIGLRTRNGWESSAFVSNALQHNFLQNVTVQAGNSGLIVGTPSDPRIVGISVRARQ